MLVTLRRKNTHANHHEQQQQASITRSRSVKENTEAEGPELTGNGGGLLGGHGGDRLSDDSLVV
jgi:hypothetical protein